MDKSVKINSDKFPDSYINENKKNLCVGLMNTIVGYTIFAILIFWNTPHLAALLVATVAGVIFNYFSTSKLAVDELLGV